VQHPASLGRPAALLCHAVPRPLVIAHRGASAEAPENTLAAFERALALGADGLELDVRLSRDGIPVVFHDATLSRLAGRRVRLDRLTLAELQTVRVRGEPIPTLVEVLRRTRNRATVQIEIKEGVPVAPIVRAVEQARAGADVILAAFDAGAVHAARRHAPRLPRMLISKGGRTVRLASALTALEAAGISLDHRAIRSPAPVEALQAGGWRVWCWTVNDPAAMLRLASWGVDAILSDHPALLRTALQPSGR